MSVTITDIANASGFSRGTVDRAINNKGRISAETRTKILKIADEMGYRADFIARSLSIGVTMTIGVVVFDIKNRYFSLLLNSIEKVAKLNNYSVLIMLQEKDTELEKEVLNNLVDRRVDGIILCPVNKGTDFTEMIKKLPMPVVTVGNRLSEEIQNVGIDEKQATISGAELIISRGYEKIVFVCPYLEDGKTENIYVHEKRKQGFVEAKERHQDIELIMLDTSNDLIDIEENIDKKKPTAFFCSGDMLALDIIKGLGNKELKVSKDYGIMGFDGLDILDYIKPTLATIKKPIKQIGEEAFDDLHDLIKGEKSITNNKLDYTIVEGQTLDILKK